MKRKELFLVSFWMSIMVYGEFIFEIGRVRTTVEKAGYE